MGWRRCACVAAAVVALVAGCGGDDTDASLPDTVATYYPEGSLGRWQAETTAVCTKYKPRQDAVVERHGQEEGASLIRELEPVAEDYRAALQAVPVAEDRRPEIERTYELHRLRFEARRALWNASIVGDEAAVQAASASLEAQRAELETLLTGLGVPACI